MKILDIYNKYKDIKREDISYLIKGLYDISNSDIICNIDIEVTSELDECISRVRKNEPLQYILGIQNFRGYDFYVDSNVLIPRPETELLVEKVLNIAKDDMKVLDLCTGSGAIIISILKERKVIASASDISQEALEIAKKNAKKNEVIVKFIKSDLFENINDKYDIIVSNPPYISTFDIKNLDSNVKDFEPHLALDGGEDGLDFYKEIVRDSHKFLRKNGYLCFEIGYNQGERIKKLLEIEDYVAIEIIKDYNGLDRIIIARRNNV